MASEKNPSYVVSYIFLRRAVGMIGLLLPVVLVIGNNLIFSDFGIEPSISDYYWTGMRDVLVGSLFAVAIFLLAYEGEEKIDARAGDLACIFACGVALFPTANDLPNYPEVIKYLHYFFAAALFLTLAFFSIFLFTKTDPNKKPTPEKLKRNMIYRICGYLILLAIGLIALTKLFNILKVLSEAYTDSLSIVFWLELTALVAFGVSWLIKGKTLFADE